MLYCHLQHHNDTIIKTDAGRLLYKYMYLSLYCKGLKRVTRGLRVRGSWRRNITTTFWPLLLWPSALCLSCSPDAQRGAQWPSSVLDDGFLYCILSASSLDPNSSGTQAPSAWCGFPYHNSSITPTPTGTGTVLTSVLTELYKSSTPTQSPTRSLKSHVWSSSSGNNCHAVHWSLSSDASVYECTMGIFFTSSHFISQFPPRRFPLITAIRMCDFLPVHHLEWHFWPGWRSEYNTDLFEIELFICIKKWIWH